MMLQTRGNAANGAGSLLKALEAPAAGRPNLSELCRERLAFRPPLPDVLAGPHAVVESERRSCAAGHEFICSLFPLLSGHKDGHAGALHMMQLTTAAPGGPDGGGEAPPPLKLGVVLSGGQASGGHNVIIGLHDYLQRWHPGSTLVGFLGGPRGVMENRHKVLTGEELDGYRNQGGFHLIGSGRDKIEKAEQLAAAAQACSANQLDGLVIIGGDDSNTNAAVLAEHFLGQGLGTRVIGVPKTIDGDLKNADVPVSFGFDTACKVYSESVGNIIVDALSAKKYWHFIKLMGRAASHVTLECALQTHPQLALVVEEVAARRQSLKDVVRQVADVVAQRAAQGRGYGVVLVPEGLVEHVHDVSALIAELNELMAAGVDAHNQEELVARLTPESAEVFSPLPPGIRAELLEERDPHGNVQVSHIETEKLLIKLVGGELARRKAAGAYRGKFSAVSHFFGYEGRCSLPSNFDATYCAALGQAAGALVAAGCTGLMATVSSLHLPANAWTVGGTPLLSMMHLERRAGRDKPVVRKAEVDLEGAPFRAYAAARARWAAGDCGRSPGPIQFHGSGLAADCATITLALEHNGGAPILLHSGSAAEE